MYPKHWNKFRTQQSAARRKEREEMGQAAVGSTGAPGK